MPASANAGLDWCTQIHKHNLGIAVTLRIWDYQLALYSEAQQSS